MRDAWLWYKQSLQVLRSQFFTLLLFQLFSLVFVYAPTGLALVGKPFIGEIASTLIQILAQIWVLVISGGIFYYYDQIILEKHPAFSVVFKPIERSGPPLIGSFVILFALSIIGVIVLAVLGAGLAYALGLSFQGITFDGLLMEVGEFTPLGLKFLLWFSILLFCSLFAILCVFMAGYFSTGLIVLFESQAWPAIKDSVRGVSRNIGSLTIISLILALFSPLLFLVSLGFYSLVAISHFGILQVIITRAVFKQEEKHNHAA